MNDVSINIPAELYPYFESALLNGIKKTKISPDIKEQLNNWWNAESEFIGDELDNQTKY